MDDYYSTLHETNDGLYMSTSRKLHLCHLWYVDEHYNFNADSCVKPFEKNEQLHNVGVKNLCCNAGRDAISRIYFIENAIGVQTIAGFYSCFVSILWWRCAITVIIELGYVVSDKKGTYFA